MNSKLIIVVVLANVVQGSLALASSSDSDSLLPESALEDFNVILANQELTIITKFNAFNPVFDLIQRAAAALAYDLTDEVNDADTKIAGALAQAKEAINHSVDSIPIAARTSSECMETARTRTHENLDNAYAAMTKAFASAASSNYTEIEGFRIEAQSDMDDLVVNVYDCIRTSLNTTSDDVLEVTKTAESGSGLGLVHVVNAVVNAIKALAAAYATGGAEASLIAEIEVWRIAALDGLRADVENKFSALKAVYINSYLEQSGLITELNANQYANTVSGYGYVAGFEVMFSFIRTLTRNSVLGFSDAGSGDLTVKEAAVALTVAKWEAAIRQILVSVKSESKTASNRLSQLSREAANAFYSAIEMANNKSSSKAEIKTATDNAFHKEIQYVGAIFNQSQKKKAGAAQKELQTVLEAAIDQLEIGANNIHNALVILAESGPTTADFAALDETIDTLQSQVTAAAQKFSDIVSYAGLKELQATIEQ